MIKGKSFSTWDDKNNSSVNFKIIEGLQQGTVTSPTLFNIYNSEVLNLFDLNSGNNTHSLAYADDMIIYCANRYPSDITRHLHRLVNNINEYYIKWNLKINPTKSELIYFRKTVNHIPFTTVQQLKTQKITITNPSNQENTEIPRKNSVKYLGVIFDHLIRMNEHHTIQLRKAEAAFKINSKRFHNKNIECKAKIICYQLLVRPIITYAAPIWWNVGPTVMESYRKCVRNCLKACLNTYRTQSSNYIKRISNQQLYNPM